MSRLDYQLLIGSRYVKTRLSVIKRVQVCQD